MTVLNEKSTGWLEVTFYDEDDAEATPTSVYYSVYDEITGQEVLARTLYSGQLDSTIEIQLGTAVQQMLSTDRERESRIVTLEATYASGYVWNGDYEYKVKRVRGL